jgi:hypothetical protein
MSEQRRPKLNEHIVLPVGRGYREATVVKVASDGDGRVARVRIRYTGWHGLSVEKWESVAGYDISYLDKE